MAITSVSVYCSSSNRIAATYVDGAREMGRLFAREGISIVYGGGNVGLMGELARSVHAHGGEVVGVIPQSLMNIEGVGYVECDELFITETMRERKRIIYQRGQAYVALAGGYGTLEEFLEVLTLRQLGYHDRQIVLLNTDGYYNTLLQFFGEMEKAGFSGRKGAPEFHVATTAQEVIDVLT